MIARPTGYNVREGSLILAERRRQREVEYLEQARRTRAAFVRYLDKRLGRAA